MNELDLVTDLPPVLMGISLVFASAAVWFIYRWNQARIAYAAGTLEHKPGRWPLVVSGLCIVGALATLQFAWRALSYAAVYILGPQ